MKHGLRLLLVFCLSLNLFAAENYRYQRPGAIDFLSTAPNNYWHFLKSSFSNESLKGWSIILGSTTALYMLDPTIVKNFQKMGRELGLGNQDTSKKVSLFKDETFMNAPTDLSSAFFFLGDGWITLGLGSGFLATGLINDDVRAVTTSSQLFQGLILSGITLPILKRMSGREEPKTKSRERGRFAPFPSSSAYADHKTKYDAFPSAHIANFMTTFTIIKENYPEYTAISPVGYSLLSLLAFQMINQGSHWASDIPLSIGLGHMLGKTLVEKGRTVSSVTTLPYLRIDGSIGALVEINY